MIDICAISNKLGKSDLEIMHKYKTELCLKRQYLWDI